MIIFNEIILIIILHISLKYLFKKISFKYNFLDYPNYRKKHIAPTPYIGGIVLSLSYLFIIYFTDINKEAHIILNYGILVALTGFLDDKFQIGPSAKISLQIISIFLVINSGLFLTNLGTYQYIPYISLGVFSKIFTMLCCLFIINAYNYIDGIDGLALSIFILIIGAFYSYSKMLGIKGFDHFFILILSVNIISLLFNLSFLKLPKIFLGNSGSNLNGFIISLCAIFLYTKFNISPSLIVWPLSFLVFEFISVNLIRILSKRKLFSPGLDHVHYELRKIYKLNNFQVFTIISFINLYLIIAGWFFFNKFGPDYSLILFTLHFLIYLIIKFILLKKLA
jgi:UDP-GlcNAc:undecaprenyl-phosphate/decaprenyl-phosphate GlcNAc-1-phosphate transferase